MSDVAIISDLDVTDRLEVGIQVAGGGFANISRGILRHPNNPEVEVAVKSLRLTGHNNESTQDRLSKRFFREVLLWRTLQHPNVVPLLGYSKDSQGSLIMVSPWYHSGNIVHYLELNPKSNRDSLALDVIDGLIYLHSVPVAHGDLKGDNVLVDAFGRASLCDFGMSQFIEEANKITGYTTTNAGIGGTYNFMCPELFWDSPKSTATDMWAAGCLVVQILTDAKPFNDLNTMPTIFGALMKDVPPSTNPNNAIKAPVWDCIKKCWSKTPEDRPTASDLRVHLAPSYLDSPTLVKDLICSAELTTQDFFDGGIKFSPYGTHLAVASATGHVSIWDARTDVLTPQKTWNPKQPYSASNRVHSVAWSPSQRQVMVRSVRFLKVFVVETGQLLVDEGIASWAEFLHDGSGVAILEEDGNISVKDLNRIENTLFTINLGLDYPDVDDIAISPGCQRITVATRSALTVYNVKSAEVEATLPLETTYSEPMRTISISQDDRFMLISSRSRVPELWGMNILESGTQMTQLHLLHRYKSPETSAYRFEKVQFGGKVDELILGVCNAKSIYIWERDNASLIHTFSAKQTVIWDMSLRWSLSKIMLAVATGTDKFDSGHLESWTLPPNGSTLELDTSRVSIS